MSIIIGADLVPTNSNSILFSQGRVDELFGTELLSELRKVDFRIFNLETPLSDSVTPIEKIGSALIAPTSTVAAMKRIPIDLFTIANNHIMDQGESGFKSTCNALTEAGIPFVGAGRTREEAEKPYVFSTKGGKIGVYACAEHEFSIVTDHSSGANPVDLLETPDHIVKLKHMCDFVIVLYHGGKEYYRYPSPMLQKVCRKLIDKGADLIICQHSHCIGSYEYYGAGCIVYGQGNFIFDDGEMECLQDGMLIKIDDQFELSFLPIRRRQNCIRLADEKNAARVLAELNARSKMILQYDMVENLYKEFAKSYLNFYLGNLHGHVRKRFVYRVVNRLTKRKLERWYFMRQYQKEDILGLRNYIECEAHQELLLAGLLSNER